MDLLSGYVALHVLLARVPERNEVVAVYSHAYAYSNGGSDASEARFFLNGRRLTADVCPDIGGRGADLWIRDIVDSN